MEQIEQYTTDGEPTGKSVERDTAHQQGIAHSTVHIWFVNSGGEILMQKRADCKESHPGKWDVSAAGHIPFGESPELAAVRECEEELGISVSENVLIRKAFFFQLYDNDDTGFHDREWVQLYIVQNDFSPEDCVLQAEEVSDVKWVTKEWLLEKADAKSELLVEHWEEYQKVVALL